ncbi:magnesium transporter [Nitrosomonas marina]|uniref:Magnesium transporter n=2 Tax=Nitrosomonas marina TaxID=917 RepID=A0A1I0DVT2_9PROT|nr:magnesium transporter [Nitrosomonas marina]
MLWHVARHPARAELIKIECAIPEHRGPIMNLEYPRWHRLHQQQDKTASISAADKSGLPPGALIHVGEKHESPGKISVVQYNDQTITECEIESITDLQQLQSNEAITWVNIDGLSNTRIIGDIGTQLNIHPLILEDILSTHQRPKLEEYDDYIYLVVKGIGADYHDRLELRYEQISILLLANCVITFKEKADDIFRPVRFRLQNRKDRLRQYGSDYLTYVLLDTVVDEYFVIEDHLDDIIDPLEDNLLANPDQKALRTIQHFVVN